MLRKRLLYVSLGTVLMCSTIFQRVNNYCLYAAKVVFKMTYKSESSFPINKSITNVEILRNVPGRSPEHSNDILYLAPDTCDVHKEAKDNRAVVYFGGDVQNLSNEMSVHRDNKHYIKWSLEETALLLRKAYPLHTIMIVKPRRMERGTFSCFDNFVQSNSCGAPTHEAEKLAKELPLTSCCKSLMQIRSLLSNICQSHKSIGVQESGPSKLTFIGFSKGVVVLNQMLHELHALSSSDLELKKQYDAEEIIKFSGKIERMVWLDGGHNGGKDTWINDEAILETIARKTDIKIDIKVTPYQVKDSRRPWIGKEETRFRTILGTKFGLLNTGRLRRELCFENEDANIENHFRILTTLSCD